MIDKKLKSLLKDIPESAEMDDEFSSEPSASADPEIIADVCKEHVALDIRGAMNEKNFSQTKLADEIGVSRQYVNQILGEMGNLTIATLSKMAAALNRQLVIRLIGENEAMPVIPSSVLPDVRRMIHRNPTRREQQLQQALMAIEFKKGSRGARSEQAFPQSQWPTPTNRRAVSFSREAVTESSDAVSRRRIPVRELPGPIFSYEGGGFSIHE